MIEGSHLLQEKYFDEDTRGAMSEWVKQQWMIKECVEERISVANVIDRWKWGFGKEDEEALVKMVEEEGLELPEQNVAAIYPESPFRPKTCKLIFCHLELLSHSSSPTIHLTQLAASNSTGFCNIFLPVLPPVVTSLLDGYRGGNLMDALKITREDKNTFRFCGEISLFECTDPVGPKCIQEEEALELFFKFLELAGPNVVLVGLDEDTIGVLLKKLESHNTTKFLQLVVGYTWWSRIHGSGKFAPWAKTWNWNLDRFHAMLFGRSKNESAITTCSTVVTKLRDVIRWTAIEQDEPIWKRSTSHWNWLEEQTKPMTLGEQKMLKQHNLQILRDFEDRIGINMMVEPRVAKVQIEAFETFIEAGRGTDKEVVYLTNSFLDEPTAAFVFHKVDEVVISPKKHDRKEVTESMEYFEEDEVKLETVNMLKKENLIQAKIEAEYLEEDSANQEMKTETILKIGDDFEKKAKPGMNKLNSEYPVKTKESVEEYFEEEEIKLEEEVVKLEREEVKLEEEEVKLEGEEVKLEEEEVKLEGEEVKLEEGDVKLDIEKLRAEDFIKLEKRVRYSKDIGRKHEMKMLKRLKTRDGFQNSEEDETKQDIKRLKTENLIEMKEKSEYFEEDEVKSVTLFPGADDQTGSKEGCLRSDDKTETEDVDNIKILLELVDQGQSEYVEYDDVSERDYEDDFEWDSPALYNKKGEQIVVETKKRAPGPPKLKLSKELRDFKMMTTFRKHSFQKKKK